MVSSHFSYIILQVLILLFFAKTHGAAFKYLFTIADSDFDINSETYGQQITIFGPDNTSMDINDLSAEDVSFSNLAHESEKVSL